MLVDSRELLRAAQAGGYAIGAFNTYNLETSQAILRAAEALQAPVIIAVGVGALGYADHTLLLPMLEARAAASSVPVAVHLDHATRLEDIVHGIRQGFTSVMIDGSALPFEENVALTRRVVETAHAAGLGVEAELGPIPGHEDQQSHVGARAAMTDPSQAASFVDQTGVDFLAVAIGNTHGFYKGESRLDLARLKAIRSQVNVPLVLHGASGLRPDAIRAAIACGVHKVNVNTEIRAAFLASVEAHLSDAVPDIDLLSLLTPTIASMQDVVEGKIRLFRGH